MIEKELTGKLKGFRRDLHRIPELDRDLPKTTAYIQAYLSTLPCEIVPAGNGGFCALFRGGAAQGGAAADCMSAGKRAASETAKVDVPSIAFRTDMDALPVEEKNEVDYKSAHAGKMHACGHDGHMSIMLGFASEIAEHIAELDKNVLLVFQNAEEATGGAKHIVASGVFEKYKTEKIYGLHLWPGHPRDRIVCMEGPFMASTMVLYIKIEGKSAHIAQYKEGIDTLEAACKFISQCYEMEKNEVSPELRRLLRFGLLRSGTANNVVAGASYLEGALRVYEEEVREFLWNRMEEISDGISARTGVKFSFMHSEPYPAVVNPKALFADAKSLLTRKGFDFFEPDEPLMIAEDFSEYQRRIPGLFMHLGTGKKVPLHNPKYEIDEDVLLTGVRIYKTLLGI